MEIPICYNATPDQPKVGDPVFMLATDVSLYFILVRVIIFYLILKFLVFDAYTFYASMSGKYCSINGPCLTTYSGYNLKSAANQSDLDIISYLAFAFVIFSIVFFLIARKQVNKLRDWLDFNEVSQDDFTVLMEDIPKFLYDEATDTISKEEIE